MDFPGTTRFVAAEEALEYLERNLAKFKKIFEDFHIPTSDYRLLAGFDEDLIRGRLGFLNQIHVFLLSEPPDMTSFLSHLSPALGKFTAFVFTDKSTYRLPSVLSDFGDIARVSTRRTAHELPSCFSTLASNVDTGEPSGVGGPSGQGSNGNDDSTKKDKEREDSERFTPPDSGKEGKGDPVLESPGPGPDGDEARDANIAFQVAAHLSQRSEPFQDLQVKGALKIKRVPESQAPPRFATCEIEFTDLLTTSVPRSAEPVYHQFLLEVRIDAKGKWSYLSKTRPASTSKYNDPWKVSNTGKKEWNSTLSDTDSFVNPQGTIGANASRTAEQSTTEKTLNVSRIIQGGIGPVNTWAFHIADPFEQEVGHRLSPEKLPLVHISFHGKTRAPPPEYLEVEIYTYWSLLSPRGGSVWLSLQGLTSPAFSNLCKTITLNIPSDLQGSHTYDADLLVKTEGR